MERLETVTQEIQRVREYICDCCGVSTLLPDGTLNWVEAQEMLHWRMTGGYGSVFGDGTKVSVDLCQTCVKTRLGDCIQIREDEETDAE